MIPPQQNYQLTVVHKLADPHRIDAPTLREATVAAEAISLLSCVAWVEIATIKPAKHIRTYREGKQIFGAYWQNFTPRFAPTGGTL